MSTIDNMPEIVRNAPTTEQYDPDVPAVPTPNQYPEPIGPKPQTILERVQAHLETYVGFANEHHSLVLSLWILHTHAFDAAYVTPYVYVSSVDPGAGKTTLMDTCADIARAPANTASITAAGMFRKIEVDRPTLFVDEVDAIYSGSKNEELRSILNGGYLYNGKATRTVGGESMDFATFCPKMLGGIDNGQLPETVLDRCIRIRLRKLSGDALKGRNVQRRNIKKLAQSETLDNLRADLARWANIETVNRISDIEPPVPEGLSARQWDIAEPLMQIAHLFRVHERALEAILAVFRGEKVETEETRILRIARDTFDRLAETEQAPVRGAEPGDRITTAMLAELVGYTPDRLSRTLSPLGITARPMQVGAGKIVRCYLRVEFESAWERYL